MVAGCGQLYPTVQCPEIDPRSAANQDGSILTLGRNRRVPIDDRRQCRIDPQLDPACGEVALSTPLSAHPGESRDPVLSSLTPVFEDRNLRMLAPAASPKALGPGFRRDERIIFGLR